MFLNTHEDHLLISFWTSSNPYLSGDTITSIYLGLNSFNEVSVSSRYLKNEVYSASMEEYSIKVRRVNQDDCDNNVTFYPNPIIKATSDILSMKDDNFQAKLRITDLSGRIVFETSMQGPIEKVEQKLK